MVDYSLILFELICGSASKIDFYQLTPISLYPTINNAYCPSSIITADRGMCFLMKCQNWGNDNTYSYTFSGAQDWGYPLTRISSVLRLLSLQISFDMNGYAQFCVFYSGAHLCYFIYSMYFYLFFIRIFISCYFLPYLYTSYLKSMVISNIDSIVCIARQAHPQPKSLYFQLQGQQYPDYVTQCYGYSYWTRYSDIVLLLSCSDSFQIFLIFVLGSCIFIFDKQSLIKNILSIYKYKYTQCQQFMIAQFYLQSFSYHRPYLFFTQSVMRLRPAIHFYTVLFLYYIDDGLNFIKHGPLPLPQLYINNEYFISFSTLTEANICPFMAYPSCARVVIRHVLLHTYLFSFMNICRSCTLLYPCWQNKPPFYPLWMSTNSRVWFLFIIYHRHCVNGSLIGLVPEYIQFYGETLQKLYQTGKFLFKSRPQINNLVPYAFLRAQTRSRITVSLFLLALQITSIPTFPASFLCKYLCAHSMQIQLDISSLA